MLLGSRVMANGRSLNFREALVPVLFLYFKCQVDEAQLYVEVFVANKCL